MRILIVATNSTPADLLADSRAGRAPRLDYVEQAERLGTRYVDYNAVRPSRALGWLERRSNFDIAQALHVARLVRSAGYAAVYSMSERVAFPLTLLLPRSTRHIVYGHHLTSPAKLRAMRLVGARRRWDRIIVPTPRDAEVVRAGIGASAEQVLMIYNAIDTRFFSPEAAPAGDGGAILSLGLAHRDYPTLLGALRRLPHVRAQLSASSAWISGQGALAGADLPPNVEALPFLPYTGVRERYAASRFVVVAVQPRTTHWTAGTVTVMQAAAMGKAVVATRNPGLASYVRDGETGLLVDEGDPQALAEAIDQLWRDPERAAAMGRRARAWAEETFSVDRWFDTFDAIAEPLLRGGSAAAPGRAGAPS